MELPWLCDVLEAFLSALDGIFSLQEDSLQCFACPAAALASPSAVGWCFPGELQSSVSDERRFLTLRTGAQSVASMAEFPWILSCPAVL